MATLRKRGTRWQVQARRKGHSVSRSFLHKADAQTWAREMEVEADRNGGVFDDQRETQTLQNLTVSDLITRYRDTISVQKKGHEFEAIRLNTMLRHPLAETPLSNLASSIFSSYREERLRKCQSETVRRELSILQHVFEVAIAEWSIPIPNNPVSNIKKPSASKPRDRRLDEDEDKVLLACRQCRNKWIEPMARFAIETGMRRGELLALNWKDIDLEGRTLHIEHTKNGHPRTIPLSSEAIRILESVNQTGNSNVFPVTRNAFKLAWKRVVKRSGVQDLHFHDLRHEAISRFFERGLSIPEVALISGHCDPRMLFRYTHLKAEDIAHKLG